MVYLLGSEGEIIFVFKARKERKGIQGDAWTTSRILVNFRIIFWLRPVHPPPPPYPLISCKDPLNGWTHATPCLGLWVVLTLLKSVTSSILCIRHCLSSSSAFSISFRWSVWRSWSKTVSSFSSTFITMSLSFFFSAFCSPEKDSRAHWGRK